MKNIHLQILKGIDSLCKHTEFRYEDGRTLDRKYTSTLHELRFMCTHVPDPKKHKTTVPSPVFDEVHVTTNRSTATVMIVSDRAKAWSVYKQMSECPFAWLYTHWHWVSIGYLDSMVRSLMEGLGPNT